MPCRIVTINNPIVLRDLDGHCYSGPSNQANAAIATGNTSGGNSYSGPTGSVGGGGGGSGGNPSLPPLPVPEGFGQIDLSSPWESVVGPDGSINYQAQYDHGFLMAEASITVNVNPRNGLLIQSGHAWLTIGFDDGSTVSIGISPSTDGPQLEDRTATLSHTWAVTNDKAHNAYKVMNQPGYEYTSDNCVGRVGSALNVAGIQHPSFTTFGIPDPNMLYDWVGGLN